jgi:hypothetical protein
MSKRTAQMTQKVFSRVGMCLLATTGFLLPAATPSTAEPAWNPVVIRGAGTTERAELRLAYLATFPEGSLAPSVDQLNAGSMLLGDTLVPGSNPTFEKGPGEIILGITRPVDLSPDLIVAQNVFATGLNFGPGSVLRLRATYIAPVGPIPSGGFAFGLVAKTGGKDDLPTEPRVVTTINVRPGFLVRLNVPFGAVETTNTVVPADLKEMMFSTTDPQPFTLELTIDRTNGTGKAKLTVGDRVVGPLSFHLSDFLVNSGPTITVTGTGPAVNANGPGKTASVHVRDFRIYTNVGG